MIFITPIFLSRKIFANSGNRAFLQRKVRLTEWIGVKFSGAAGTGVTGGADVEPCMHVALRARATTNNPSSIVVARRQAFTGSKTDTSTN